MDNSASVICKSCKQPGDGKFCSSCGQSLHLKRITVSGLLHEVFHFFTHLDKGFGYTLKQLIKRPGHMQREYLEGQRNGHQKPFSFFFIAATVMGLSLYWINILLEYVYEAGNLAEGAFFHQYMVLLMVLSMPYFALIKYLFFYNSGYNFAETGVLILYMMSVLFLIVIIANMFKFFWPGMETRYIEVPSVLIYSIVTNIHFYNQQAKWKVVIKTILAASLWFYTIARTQDLIVDKFFR